MECICFMIESRSYIHMYENLSNMIYKVGMLRSHDHVYDHFKHVIRTCRQEG